MAKPTTPIHPVKDLGALVEISCSLGKLDKRRGFVTEYKNAPLSDRANIAKLPLEEFDKFVAVRLIDSRTVILVDTNNLKLSTP